VADKRVGACAFSLLGAFAICGLLACSRYPSEAELKSHFTEGGGPDWFFVTGGHINFDGPTASAIKQWLITHDTDWKPASLSDFDPAKTQLLTDNSAVEIDGDRIVVSFERSKTDTDTTTYIQRRLTSSEQSFWNALIEQINTPNHAVQSTEPAASPQAKKATRYDPTSLIEVKALSDFPSQVQALANASFMSTKYDNTPTKFLVGGVSRSSAIIAYEEFGYVPFFFAQSYVYNDSQWIPAKRWSLGSEITNLHDLVAATNSLD
jgi:hypothetical protein